MRELLQCRLGGRQVHLAYTTRADGDLSPATVTSDVLSERRRSIVDRSWCAVRQVHSDRVLRVDQAAAEADRRPADAMVTDEVGVVLAVHSGDCATIGLVHESGAIGVAHGGWKGLEAGVLESTVRELRRHDREGARTIWGAVGPHIRASRYEFGTPDLDRLARRFGDVVVARTIDDRPALDLTAVVAHELDRLGVEAQTWAPGCTARDAADFWSHRARREAGRNALIAWIEPL